MVDDFKPPVRRPVTPPTLSNMPRPSLPVMRTGNAWLGTERMILDKNRRTVEADTAYIKAREAQSTAFASLIDANMRLIGKYAELSDLPNVIAEQQQQREHARWQAKHNRQNDHLQADYDDLIANARNEAELARVREKAVRAQRNHDAAGRVSAVQSDQWYAEAVARRNNAEAERQDTAADLARNAANTDASASADAAAQQRAQDRATIDHQIELERQRGNEAAVIALLNVRARLQGT